ncbi:MAG TPA: hypothetical protein VD905_01660 [Flavobacteriales bacterium]|nr:hypothetical protein [Flavobacteriales bacterium]
MSKKKLTKSKTPKSKAKKKKAAPARKKKAVTPALRAKKKKSGKPTIAIFNGFRDSGPVTAQQMNGMLAAYQAHNSKIKVKKTDGTIVDCYGMRFNADDIANILNITRDPSNSVKELFLMFGAKPMVAGQSDTYITIIGGGIVEDSSCAGGRLVTNVLYDFCDPCPTKCPKDFPNATCSS